jgi:putative endonuclease
MNKKAEIGENGELLAKKFLEEKAYIILHSNWRYKRSEIDIIAKDKNNIVFIEVKARNSNLFGNPEDFVNDNKIKKMREAADAYIEQYDWHGELRFDIIAIEKDNKITHFKDAFY